jgi:hypothetical protein
MERVRQVSRTPSYIQGLPAFLPRAAAVAAVSTAARTTLGPWPSFVYIQRSAIDIFAVQAVDYGVPFCVHAHLDEGKAPGLSRFTVSDEVHHGQPSRMTRTGTQRIFSGPETKITYKKCFSI